jgi:alcohol dehydrogenase class IV
LPAVISANSSAAGAKYAQIARQAGFGGTADTMAVRNLKNGLIQLRKELSLPATLTQAGLDPHTVWRASDQIVKTTLEDPCCTTNPVQVEGFTVRRVLEEVTGRG